MILKDSRTIARGCGGVDGDGDGDGDKSGDGEGCGVGVGEGEGGGEGEGEGEGVGIRLALGDATISMFDSAPCAPGFDSPLGRKESKTAPSDTTAAIKASHRALFDICGVESVFSSQPHFKQNTASSGNSVPHF